MKNYKAVLPAVLFIIFTLAISLYIVNKHYRAGDLIPKHQISIAQGESASIINDEKLQISGSNIQIAIEQHTATGPIFGFYNANNKLSERDHIYNVRTLGTDNTSYAIVELSTVFDLCHNETTIIRCAENVYKRFQTPEICESAIGVISISYCQDILWLGKATVEKDEGVCRNIQLSSILNVCKSNFN